MTFFKWNQVGNYQSIPNSLKWFLSSGNCCKISPPSLPFSVLWAQSLCHRHRTQMIPWTKTRPPEAPQLTELPQPQNRRSGPWLHHLRTPCGHQHNSRLLYSGLLPDSQWKVVPCTLIAEELNRPLTNQNRLFLNGPIRERDFKHLTYKMVDALIIFFFPFTPFYILYSIASLSAPPLPHPPPLSAKFYSPSDMS